MREWLRREREVSHRGLKEVRLRRRELASGVEIGRYLDAHRVRKLPLGAGHDLLPGWLNTDHDPDSGTVYLDAARRCPFADEPLSTASPST